MVAERVPQRDEISEAELASYRQVLDTVRSWPSTLQIDLAQNILGFIREAGYSTAYPRYSGPPLNPMYYISRAKEQRGYANPLTEEQMRQLIADYQAATSKTLTDEEYARLLLDVKLEYEPHERPPRNPRAFRERSFSCPSTGLPPPTDEEIAQWIEEYRTEKYG